ncbi:hypothetical protein FOMPIDRAFT_93871 [Fomitopsis schrenkii]|uniref:F-box domain-containing protein n=1 Tax=Fomitopsis schrenkii TaxID=2126942 RepID=S8EVX2_FOMSC|nr:hypothetical protein FOMPIDRAFT_93871 [Fomitopsis schrenkii]
MASRAELEQQKAHYYECIRVVNTQLNALLPISRLPHELLSEVFLHHAEYRAEPTSQEPKSPRDWICVTHVCTHWREVALQCPTLWTRFHASDSLDMLPIFLARSKDAPLSVSMSFDAWQSPITRRSKPQLSEESLILVLTNLHRMRLLSVEFSSDPLDDVLAHISGPAPLLESLSIAADISRSSAKPSKLVLSFTRMISHPESRRLRCLATRFRCLVWDSVSLIHLTRLEVQGCGSGVSGTDAMSFFEALARMPLLEQLDLNGVFEVHHHGYSAVLSLLDPIPFLRLRRLRLQYENTYTTTDLLNNLHTPSLLHLCVIMAHASDAEVPAPLFAALAHKTTTLGEPLTIALSLDPWNEVECTSRVFIRMYRQLCCSTVEPGKDDSTSAWLEQHVPAFEYSLVPAGVDGATLATICELLPAVEAKTLLLNCRYPTLCPEQWRGFTGCLETVTELRLYGTAQLMFRPSTALCQKQSGPDTGGTPQFVLPNLRIFTMDGINFWRAGTKKREWAERPERGTIIISDLRASFAQRAQEGAEIQTLRILRAERLWAEDLESFREVVSCVESDGRLESPSTFHDRMHMHIAWKNHPLDPPLCRSW